MSDKTLLTLFLLLTVSAPVGTALGIWLSYPHY